MKNVETKNVETIEKNCERINQYWQMVKETEEKLNKLAAQFKEEWNTEKYENPLEEGYAMNQLVENIRKRLISFIVTRYNKAYCPNVTININDVIQEMKIEENGFDALEIAKHIRKKYILNAASLSFREILNNARKLLPVFWENYSRRQTTKADILEGRKLILRMPLTDYGKSVSPENRYYLNSDNLKNLNAFEKFVKVVIDKKSPLDVENGDLANLYPYHSSDMFETKEYKRNHIERLRLFKNSKLAIWMDSEKNASIVAETLTIDHYNGKEELSEKIKQSEAGI